MNEKSHSIVATFEDKYGDTRTVHRGKNGLAIKRQVRTPALVLNRPIAKLIGQKIRKKRLECNLTMEELGKMAGMTSDAKSRIWTIENAKRGEGLRMGTLYALAISLKVEAIDLMPTNKEVIALCDQVDSTPTLVLAVSRR